MTTPVADLALVTPGATDSVVGVDESSGTARRFPVADIGTSFIQSGTGAVSNTVQGKARERVSVLDFMTDAERADALLDTPVLDHTAAFQAAINKALLKGEVLHAVGRFRVTDELSITSSLIIDGGHNSKDVQSAPGSAIIYDHADAQRGALAIGGTDASTGVVLRNIEILAGGDVANQPAMRLIDNFHYLLLDRVQFTGVCGYSVLMDGDTYGQNVVWRDVSFNNVGGLLGFTDSGLGGVSSNDLNVSLFRFDNINLDSAIKSVSPQPHILDLRRCREIVSGNLLLEGTMPAGVVTSCVALGANQWALFDGNHFEWVGSLPTYSFYIDDTGAYGQGSASQLTIRGLSSSASPIRINTTDAVRLNIEGWEYASATQYSDLVSEIAGAHCFGTLEVLSSVLIEIPENVRGRVIVDNTVYSGTNEARGVFFNKGPLFNFRGGALRSQFDSVYNAPVTITTSGATAGYVSLDTEEGRVWCYDGSTVADFPHVYFRVRLPAAYEGALLTFAIRYKVVTTSTPFVLAAAWMQSGLQGSVVEEELADGAWHTARLVARISDPANVEIISRKVSGTIDAATTLKIAAIDMNIGPQVDEIHGTFTANDRIEQFGSAAPTKGDYIAGDKLWYLAPTASGKIGQVCVTAGNPGTWKTWGAIDA